MEILVAMVVMGIAVVYLAQLFSSNLRMMGASQASQAVLPLAETLMREIVESDMIEEKSWVKETDQGLRMEVSVEEILKERTEHLSVKLLQIEMTLFGEKALHKGPLTLRTLKVVNKIDNRGNIEQKS